jgi:hypothetical protein
LKSKLGSIAGEPASIRASSPVKMLFRSEPNTP